MAATFLTGGNSRSIEASSHLDPPQKRPFLKWMNVIAGTAAIGLNLYFLVVKDQDRAHAAHTAMVSRPSINERAR